MAKKRTKKKAPSVEVKGIGKVELVGDGGDGLIIQDEAGVRLGIVSATNRVQLDTGRRLLPGLKRAVFKAAVHLLRAAREQWPSATLQRMHEDKLEAEQAGGKKKVAKKAAKKSTKKKAAKKKAAKKAGK